MEHKVICPYHVEYGDISDIEETNINVDELNDNEFKYVELNQEGEFVEE